MNHPALALLAFSLALGLTAACGAETVPAGTEEAAVQDPVETVQDVVKATEACPATEEEAVSQAVLDRARTGYRSGECPAEGHIILRAEDGPEEDTLVVYALCSAGNYAFVNGNLEEISGSGVIPSRLTFALGGDGFLTLLDYWEAEDGAGYDESIRRTFPADLVSQALEAGARYPELLEQKEAYALACLRETGREAAVGEYADFDHPLATDRGMSAAASNTLMERMPEYPFFLGSEERVEDGVRWVYETAWDGEGGSDGTATYTKSNYETGEIEEQHVFQVRGDDCTEIVS